ncbi:ferredoxin [Cryptosporangium aurantiacum]|uniref:Ferredoxin n=1 Tax=Cryptosporangium aurantiacum TaxID=134849 RepID=A0A1M7RG46_9ACTN|nr:(4Fe-4S)-binding protein [Cryptosporangium aurantiacum]SHN45265.1 ferredoxin [Cryptosporangium aurantiacum]
MTTIDIDRDVCIGSGMCVVAAPGAFGQDDSAVAVVVDPDGEPAGVIAGAVEACPTGALTLRED